MLSPSGWYLCIFSFCIKKIVSKYLVCPHFCFFTFFCCSCCHREWLLVATQWSANSLDCSVSPFSSALGEPRYFPPISISVFLYFNIFCISPLPLANQDTFPLLVFLYFCISMFFVFLLRPWPAKILFANIRMIMIRCVSLFSFIFLHSMFLYFYPCE